MWDLQWLVVQCQQLAPGSDLYAAMMAAIELLKRKGWEAEGSADFAFVFAL